MSKINHLNYIPENEHIYCERLRSIVHVNHTHIMHYCDECPMYNGALQGEGIECLYEDPDAGNEPFVVVRGSIDVRELCNRRQKRFDEQKYGKKGE